jgi:hypothetical protein
MLTFKEFLAEFEDESPMVIDPEFVANNPQLQQAQKGSGSPSGQKRFQAMYKREVMRNAEQRRKQKMMDRAKAKASRGQSKQDPSVTGISPDQPGTSGGNNTTTTGYNAGSRGID